METAFGAAQVGASFHHGHDIFPDRQATENAFLLGQGAHPEATPPVYMSWRLTSLPSKATGPSVGGSRPKTRENVVVFPAPFDPGNPTITPWPTWISTPRTTARPSIDPAQALGVEQTVAGMAGRKARGGLQRSLPSPAPPFFFSCNKVVELLPSLCCPSSLSVMVSA